MSLSQHDSYLYSATPNFGMSLSQHDSYLYSATPLFYHLKLRCYVVIDLKMGEFKPEFSGKMNFYISAVDDLLKHVDDQPTIGIILCRSKNRAIAEYALRGLQKPISVATHQVGLPSAFASKLPTIEQLEAEMNTVVSQTIHNSKLPLEE